MPAVLGGLGAALVALGYLALVLDTWRSAVVPNGVTWVFATVLSGVALESQWALGAWWSLGICVVQVTGSAVMLALAVRRRWRWTRFDAHMMLLAVLILGSRVLLDDPTATIWLTVAGDAAAMLPCVRDAYSRPDEVALRGWVLDAAGAGLGALAVASWSVTLLAYPVYIFLVNLAVIAAVWEGTARRAAAWTPSSDPVAWLEARTLVTASTPS